MEMKQSSLFVKLASAIAEFAEQNQIAGLDLAIKQNSEIVNGEVASVRRLWLTMTESSNNCFLATLDRNKDGSFKEPIYISQGTPAGNLYERFCEFIAKEPFNIKSKHYIGAR